MIHSQVVDTRPYQWIERSRCDGGANLDHGSVYALRGSLLE